MAAQHPKMLLAVRKTACLASSLQTAGCISTNSLHKNVYTGSNDCPAAIPFQDVDRVPATLMESAELQDKSEIPAEELDLERAKKTLEIPDSAWILQMGRTENQSFTPGSRE